MSPPTHTHYPHTQLRGDLEPNARRKVNTLVITDVHARDVADALVRDSVLDAADFAWEAQLRFYWDRASDDLVIRQCGGAFRYGYEFMGLNGRLVATPLTDRCYVTLTTALAYRLGGAPAGPAGTGAQRVRAGSGCGGGGWIGGKQEGKASGLREIDQGASQTSRCRRHQLS